MRYVGSISVLVIIVLIILLGVKMHSPAEQAENAPASSTPEVADVTHAPRVAQIDISPQVILPGDPVLITVDSDSVPLTIKWDQKVLSLFLYEGKTRALVPVDFNEKILKHTVTVKFSDDKTVTKEVTLTLRPKIEKPLGIPEKLGGNTPAAATNLLDNLAKENLIINNVKTATTTLWTKAFQYPLANVFITDDYGYSRETVGQTIPHKGTDFRAQIGTEVHAMNRGVVRIARLFTAYGNTVVIDHGLGVQTLYMHMSKLNVKESETVEAGQIIGLSGDTGYADAAHLHISVKIDAVSIDPMTFLRFFVR